MKFLITFATIFSGLAFSTQASAHVGVSIGVGFGGHPHPSFYGHYYHPYDYDVGYHRYWHHGYYNGRMGWWWVNGGNYTYYDQPVYPYPQTVIVQEPAAPAPPPPTVVIQQPPQPIQELPSPTVSVGSGAIYYYCRDPQGYYPTVPSCPSGWAASPAPNPR